MLIMMLMKVSLVLALSIFCSIQGNIHKRILDKDSVQKQLKIYELFLYINQDSLIDAAYYEAGKNYDIIKNMNNYGNVTVVEDFLDRYEQGLLRPDMLYSAYNEAQLDNMLALYNVLYYAKDFSTFYKTASWARLHVNNLMFFDALLTAIIYRRDTKYSTFPMPYEIYPKLFFDSKIIQDAQRKQIATGTNHDINKNFVLIHSNDTDACSLEKKSNSEYKLSYYFEDIGLNTFYFYFRISNPFWMSANSYNLSKIVDLKIRGEYFFFVNQKLMAHYHLERLSNRMSELKQLNWNTNFPGFYSNLSFPNGVPLPQRNESFPLPMSKMSNLQKISEIESRLTEAIDSGYFVDKGGNKISIFDHDGITNLGTILEGNKDSLNLEYYGSYDQLLRNMFDHISVKSDKVSYVPSALQFFVTSMRDPLFYRITDMVMKMFWRFKERQPLYRYEDLSYAGVHIKSVDADSILTYFEPFDVTINNALYVRSLKDGLSFNIKTRNYRLNHQPWNITLTVNSNKHTRASIRVFLCPVDENQDLYAFVRKNYMKYVVQIDKWTERLQPGTNIIVRNSRNAMFTQNFKESAESYLEFYKKLHKAGEKKKTLVFDPPHYGFPNNLVIPKGRPEGIRYKVIVFLHSFEALRTHEIPLFGEHAYDGKPLGFPLDRPVEPWIFDLPNAFVTDTMIYHKDDTVTNCSPKMNFKFENDI